MTTHDGTRSVFGENLDHGGKVDRSAMAFCDMLLCWTKAESDRYADAAKEIRDRVVHAHALTHLLYWFDARTSHWGHTAVHESKSEALAGLRASLIDMLVLDHALHATPSDSSASERATLRALIHIAEHSGGGLKDLCESLRRIYDAPSA